MHMAERSPFFSAKTDNQKIGYVEGNDAFDLLGNRRCNYSLNTGNLLELDSGRIVGHVSLAGYFVGASWIANELFPQSDTNAALTGQINEPAAAAYAAPAIHPTNPPLLTRQR
jgi:hypothetical protein